MRETVPVAEDTYVNSNAPDSANGGQTYMKIQRGGGRSFLGLVKFNVNGVIAENAAVLSAKLKLPVHSSTSALVDPQVYACLDNGWSESTVTYRNNPAIAELLDSQSGTFDASTTVEFDLTNKVATETQDFQASATASSVATLPYPTNDGSWSEVSLDAAGLAAINKIGSTQMRLGFATDDDNDGTADYLGFYSGDNSTVANRPKLVIVYH